jgi:hypothetical protein
MENQFSQSDHANERKSQPRLVQKLVPFHWHTEAHAGGEKIGSPGDLGSSKSRRDPNTLDLDSVGWDLFIA